MWNPKDCHPTHSDTTSPYDMRYAICMKRTTIMLPDALDERLRGEARRRGVSIADVARNALEHELPEPARDGALSFFAIGAGGPKDAAKRAEDFVGRAISRRHPAR
jgi:Ribbon-helix-helix protein, copG family